MYSFSKVWNTCVLRYLFFKAGPALFGRSRVALFLCGLCAIFSLPPAAWAQTVQRNPQVIPSVQFDVSPPLRDIKPVVVSKGEHEAEPARRIPRPSSVAGLTDTALQRSYGPQRLAPATVSNFNGVGNGFIGPSGAFTVQSAPPDTNMAIGPNHIVQIVNSDFAVFNKAGTVLLGPLTINSVWSGFGGGCETNNDGDPVMQYDKIADRWIISQFSVSSTPYLECVAVSTSPDPTGSYTRYAFNYGNTDFPDYPKLSVWPDAYYITYNIFSNGTTFAGARICALDRTRMLAGTAATQQCLDTGSSYGGVLPADLDGSTLPPAGSPNYILGLGASANQLAYWKFHVDWTTTTNSTLTGPTTLATSAFSELCSGGTCVPQNATTQQLDSLADRMMYRLAYRNFGDHEALVANHSVTAASSGGIRWYELRLDGSHNASIFQQGTYAPDASFRWMGSIAMDKQGDMGLGFSVSNSSIHPEIHYTGRLAGDASGTMTQGEGSIIDGAGSQTGSSLSRWGDYSAMRIDPSDDCTFWYTTEYIPANGAFNWATRIASFRFPGCTVVVQPPTISKAFGAATIRLNGTTTLTFTINNPNASVSLSGVGFTDTLPAGLVVATPNGLSGSCGAGNITATQATGSITLAGGTLAAGGACTFSVNVTGTAAGDIANTTGAITSTEGGTGTTSNTATLKVVAPPTISKAFGPSAVTLNGTTTVTFTITNPAADTTAENGIAFSDTLTNGLKVAGIPSVSNTCGGTATAVAASTSISLSGGSIATPGSTCTVAVNVTATQSGSIPNTTGTVSSTNGGTGATSNTAILGVGSADIAVTLAHHPDPAAMGGRLFFVATVTNNGPQAANVSLTESFTGAQYVVSAGATQGAGTCGTTAPVSCTLSGMSNGEVRQITIVVTPLLGRNVVGTATVTPDVTDPNSSNNSASSTARIRMKPQRY